MTVFHKNDSDVPLPGQSEKDMVWTKLLAVFDDWQVAWGDRQFEAVREGGKYNHTSREELLSEFLRTKEGQKLYAEYQAADDTVTPVKKAGERQPKTLEEYSWRKLERIAKAYQAKKGGTIESAHLACMTDSLAYRETYHLGYASPLSRVDYSTRISKSVQDAIVFTKVEIDAVAEGD